MRLFLLLALLILTVAAERNPIKSVADKKRSKVENQLSEKSKGRRYLKKILDLPRQSSVLDKVANKETRKVENELKLRQKTIPKPKILASGICASSPQLPCCKETIKIVDRLKRPGAIADVGFPDCRPDGYYEPRQCSWHSCYCVDANGEFIKNQKPDGSLNCPGEVLDVVADKETRKVENQFEFEKKEIAASLVDV